ncbi:hypothetical protein ACQEVF_04740 [Nonomuraea polychroma]|uniref:hypothetical protein n=1 Tax=Nonomuraea polychroma TaxID=46176 RepID=UPI003D91CC9F
MAGATQLAVRMVREYGLSRGPVAYPASAAYLDVTGSADHPYAEATQRIVDREVARFLRLAEAYALDLLTVHREALDDLVARLLEEETLDGHVVYDIAGPSAPTVHTAAGTRLTAGPRRPR